jgi:tRNA pseudouridine55 synthase
MNVGQQVDDDARPDSRRATIERPKIVWRPVHGVLLIDKPSGITSTAALARARRALRAEKGGHTGTLDPMASGLLPLCFGEATKFASDLLDADKAYVATLQLGVTTDSGDAEGQVTAIRPVDVDRAAIDRVIARFRGPIAQVPPMHSALKRDGKPLYHYARQGITVERAARAVTIHRLDVTGFDGRTLSIAVDCSKGTYIRVLAEDIGDALGCGAHLIALHRDRVGSLTSDASIALAAIESMSPADRDARLLPIDTLIAGLPRIDLDPVLAGRFLDGQRLAWASPDYQGRARVYLSSPGDSLEAVAPRLLGTALVGYDDRLAPVRLVAQASYLTQVVE